MQNRVLWKFENVKAEESGIEIQLGSSLPAKNKDFFERMFIRPMTKTYSQNVLCFNACFYITTYIVILFLKSTIPFYFSYSLSVSFFGMMVLG
jgi:hypothetical protein